jgi:hypothetical protein
MNLDMLRELVEAREVAAALTPEEKKVFKNLLDAAKYAGTIDDEMVDAYAKIGQLFYIVMENNEAIREVFKSVSNGKSLLLKIQYLKAESDRMDVEGRKLMEEAEKLYNEVKNRSKESSKETPTEGIDNSSNQTNVREAADSIFVGGEESKPLTRN